MIKRTDKKTSLYIYILLAVLTFVVYLGVLGNDFTNYDDDAYVTENLQTQAGITFNGIKWAFTTNHTGYWHPLTWMSLMLDSQLFGVKPWGYHLTSLIIHIANVLLLFAVLNVMTGTVWRSAFVAVIFAVHPLNVESVAWVAERKNVLSTMFWFLAIGSYWQYSKGQNLKWYLLTLLLFAMGLMSKPMLVTLPFTLLLLDYWPLERLKSLKDWKAIWKLVIEKVPFFVLSVVSGIITIWGQKSEGVVADSGVFSLLIRIENAILSYEQYIIKMLYPNKLSILYPFSVQNLKVLGIAGAIVLLVMVSALIMLLSKRRRYLLMGWLWYIVTLLPVIGLIQVGSQAMADRYTYIPIIGLLIIVIWGVAEILKNQMQQGIAFGLVAFIIVSILSILTILQLHYWRDSITVFRHAIDVTENSYIAYGNLGDAYREAGNYEKAIEYSKESIRLMPNYSKAYTNIAAAYNEIGDYKGAIEACTEAIRLQPINDRAYCNLGVAYLRLENFADAAKAFEKSIKIKPNAESYLNLGVAAYDKAGEYEKEIEVYRKAIELKPNFAEAWFNLGNVYARLKRYIEAKEAFKMAVTIKPNFEDAHLDLGRVYIYLENKQAAIEEYKILRTINTQKAERLMAEINKGIRQTMPAQ